MKSQKSEDYKEKYLRALADYQNLERRLVKEKEVFVKYANWELIKKLLPVFDSLSKAQEQGRDEGVKLIYKQLWEVLEGEGLEKIEVMSKKFDPQIMECVEVVKGKKDKVIEKIRAGYKLKGKVIRVAQVKVGG